MNSQPLNRLAGLVLMFLVVSLPFYSASALSIKVTKNSGEDGINNYIDANGDVWKVDASITDAPSDINPQEVIIEMGGDQRSFESCSSGSLGGMVCTYTSPLTDGVLEGEYQFQVSYQDVFSPSEIIRADGSAPTISVGTAKQNSEGGIDFSFTVAEPGQLAVGLKQVQILDADTNAVLFTELFPDTKIVNYISPEKLDFTFSSDGEKRIKVQAEDLLGHQEQSTPVKLKLDYTAPAVKSLEFPNLEEYIGSGETELTFEVKIEEQGNLKAVTASSSQANLEQTAPSKSCTREGSIWTCRWEKVIVKSVNTLEVTIAAEDDLGNKVTAAVSSPPLKIDSTPPEIIYFNSEFEYDGAGYVKGSSNKIILLTKDTESGVETNKILADLSDINGFVSQKPVCALVENSEVIKCIWEVTGSPGLDGTGQKIILQQLMDHAGNKAVHPPMEVIVDTLKPVVESIKVLGVSEVGAKDYFQSGDFLRIDLAVEEANGLVLLLNLEGIVPDAITKFPDGWAVFNQDSCERQADNVLDNKWKCSFEVDSPIVDGPFSNVNLQFKLSDTAGNEVKVDDFKFDILALDDQDVSDHWEVKSVNLLTIPLDIESTGLVPPRMPVEVVLGKVNLNSPAEVLSLDLQGCTPSPTITAPPILVGSTQQPAEEPAAQLDAPAVQQAILYSGVTIGEINPKPKIVLELAPFDGREYFKVAEGSSTFKGEIEYTCQLRIFSKVGKKAIRAPELQEVKISVPFAFSTLGAADENLNQKIEDLKDWLFDVAEVTKYINVGLDWVRWATNIITFIDQVVTIFNIVKGAFGAVEKTVVGRPIASAACVSLSGGQESIVEGVEWLQIPLAILNCDPRTKGQEAGETSEEAKKDFFGKSDVLFDNAYGQYQATVLEAYNVWSGRALLGLPAESLYENIYTSSIGLCPTGIIYNLEKYRQVRCQEILCYKNDIPAGLATVDSCSKRADYLTCRYFIGSFASSHIPLIKAWDSVIGFIKSWASSPVGLARAALEIPCRVMCAADVTGSAYCTFATTIIKLGDIVNTVAGAVQTFPTQVSDPYCSRI